MAERGVSCWIPTLASLLKLSMLTLPDHDFEGYIFDCDGTLADSMPVHYEAWCAALEHYNAGFKFEEELFYKLGGVPTRRIIQMLNEDNGTSLDPDQVAHTKEDYYLEKLTNLQPVQQVVDIAREVSKTHSVSVASGGFKRVVLETLDLIHVRDIFEHIVTAEDVTHGKPSPDMFLLAAEKMGVNPENCLVFEDGEMGIEAANRAGMEHVYVDARALEKLV